MDAIKDIIPNTFDNVNLNREYINSSQNKNSSGRDYNKENEFNYKRDAKNNLVKSENIIYVKKSFLIVKHLGKA
jgi:hypothetical protein